MIADEEWRELNRRLGRALGEVYRGDYRMDSVTANILLDINADSDGTFWTRSEDDHRVALGIPSVYL